MAERGHPDAAQDEGLILEVMQRELQPVFQTLVQRLTMLEEELQGIKQLTNGIVEGFGEAVSTHRRGSLASSIDLSDIGNESETYKDLEGSDLKEDLIDYLMDNDVSDDQIEEALATLKENVKGKYGKYKRAEPEAPVPEEGDGVLAVKIGVKPGEEAPEEEAKPENAADSMFKKVMAQHKQNKGIKL